MNKAFFETAAGETVGTLDFNGPEMVFTGNADESAKVFLDFFAKHFSNRLKQERETEREACAKVCEEVIDRCVTDCAAAIRARGEA